MTDLREQLATELGDTYRIESELGGGGMSRVFVAEELALGRKVVIKVLAPRVAAEMSLERFTREIKIAAGLQEPHIVPVLAAGTVTEGPGGNKLPYYTMPFIAGESLRQRMRRTPRVTVPEALDILRGILAALVAAHEAGIIHRDIKPENVLLTRTGVPMVTDFGIAKAISAASSRATSEEHAGGDELTLEGTAIGTPSYMAPEQVLGQPLDQRADLYAWGMIGYEMLAGGHPFAGRANRLEITKAQVFETPGPLAPLNADAPAALIAVIEQCLAKEPADRPASASAILVALRDPTSFDTRLVSPVPIHIVKPGPLWKRQGGIAFGLIAIAVVAIIAALRARGGDRVATTDGLPGRIAIAPFANRTGDSTLTPLGEMASDWITRGLTETGLMDVIPIAGGVTSDVGTLRAAARDAGASTFLDGDIYKAGDSVSFVPTLLDVRSGRVIASVDPVSVPRGNPTSGLAVLRGRVAGVLAARVDPTFDTDRLLGDPPSFEVYRLLLDAMTEASVGHLGAAMTLLRRAEAADTSYLVPVLAELTILQDARNPPRADSLLRQLNARRDRLTDYEQRTLTRSRRRSGSI